MCSRNVSTKSYKEAHSMRESNKELHLGAILLKTALGDGADDVLTTDRYKDILNSPGIDGALYLLYQAVSQDTRSDAKTLAQAAYMLGYYVANSVKEIDSLWDNGPTTEPNLDWRE